jgi:hypothetical protein
VTNDNHLLDHEEEHAREWGKQLATAVADDQPASRKV